MIKFTYMLTGTIALILSVFLLLKGDLLSSIVTSLVYLSTRLNEIELQISELKSNSKLNGVD